MNKNGQSLVLFVIFLPIILLMVALVVDLGICYNAKIRGNNLLKEAKKDNIDIEEYFNINEFEITSISKKDNCVIIKSRVESVFGRIAKIYDYEVEISDC